MVSTLVIVVGLFLFEILFFFGPFCVGLYERKNPKKGERAAEAIKDVGGLFLVVFPLFHLSLAGNLAYCYGFLTFSGLIFAGKSGDTFSALLFWPFYHSPSDSGLTFPDYLISFFVSAGMGTWIIATFLLGAYFPSSAWWKNKFT